MITAVTGSGYTGMLSIPFTIAKKAGRLEFAHESLKKYCGDAAFTNRLTAETDGDITYTSSDPDVAEVDPVTGKVTIIATGTTTISASASTGKNYESASAGYVLNVYKRTATLKFSVAYVNSSGKITTYKPGSATITLTYKNGKKTLKYYCNVTVKENVYYDYTFADVTGDTFEYGGPGLCIHKLQYNGNDLEIVAICKNNRMFYADYFDYVTLRVYD